MSGELEYIFHLFINIILIVIVPMMIILGEWFSAKHIQIKSTRRSNLRVALVVSICLIAITVSLFGSDTIEYCKDIPDFFMRNFDITDGSIERIYGGENGSPSKVEVSGITLKGIVSYSDRQEYKKFKFYYLHNSKYIMKYEGYNKGWYK